jgi:polar amino acid transport system substrate-binding protein
MLAAGAAPWATALAQASESTWERVTRTKVMRVGAVDGGLPYYKKDMVSGEWLGCMADFYRGLAKSLDAKLDITPTSWGNSVLELQSQKIDIFFGLNPTPARLQVIDFTDPVLNIAFAAVCKKGYAPKTWAELDQPRSASWSTRALRTTRSPRACSRTRRSPGWTAPSMQRLRCRSGAPTRRSSSYRWL